MASKFIELLELEEYEFAVSRFFCYFAPQGFDLLSGALRICGRGIWYSSRRSEFSAIASDDSGADGEGNG